MNIVENFASQSNQPLDAEVMSILPPTIWSDPQVRLLLELRAISSGAGSRARISMRGVQLALRLAAARLGMSGLPAWWAKVPATRDTEMIVYLADGESPGEPFFETFPPFGPLRDLIKDAAAALAAQEAAL
jgi:hypothetical protein